MSEVVTMVVEMLAENWSVKDAMECQGIGKRD